MEIFNFIAGLASIVSLLLTIFITTKVYNIGDINNNNLKNSPVGRDFTGGSKK